MLDACKKYEHPFRFSNTAKIIYVANQLPPLSDAVANDEAFWRRCLVIEFKHRHKKTDDNMRIKLKAEASGIINWMIEGLLELNKDSHLDGKLVFCYTDDAEEIWMNNLQVENPLSEWMNANFELGGNSIVWTDTAYAFYLAYAKEKGDKLGTKNYLTRQIKTFGGISKCTKDAYQKSHDKYDGIQWKVERYQDVYNYENGIKTEDRRKEMDMQPLIEYIKTIIRVEYVFKERPIGQIESDLYKTIRLRVKADSKTFELAFDKSLDELFTLK
jgi:phage/plasmid-associated DNA primase